MDTEKEYLKLPVYKGKRNFCESCKRPFQSGEIISLNLNGGALFCYSDGRGLCTAGYFMFPKSIRVMRFRNGYLSEKDRTLTGAMNPTASLLEWKPEKKSWFMTLLEFMDF